MAISFGFCVVVKTPERIDEAMGITLNRLEWMNEASGFGCEQTKYVSNNIGTGGFHGSSIEAIGQSFTFT